MDGIADHPQRGFEVTVGGLEGVSIDRQWRPEDNQRRPILRALDRLFE
jgi:hypothetical protein